MLPSRFPDEGQAPEYNTVDAILWCFEAIRAYHEAILRSSPFGLAQGRQGRLGDKALLRDLFAVLQEIVDRHASGCSKRMGEGLRPSPRWLCQRRSAVKRA